MEDDVQGHLWIGILRIEVCERNGNGVDLAFPKYDVSSLEIIILRSEMVRISKKVRTQIAVCGYVFIRSRVTMPCARFPRLI